MVLFFVAILPFTVIFVTEQTIHFLFIFKSFLGLFDIYSAKINSPPL